jgi:uridine phosphorylase
VTTLPLAEFDDTDGLIAPRSLRHDEPFPDRAVLCFFPEVLLRLEETGRAHRIARFSGESGGAPVLVVDGPAGPVVALHPGVGAPLAALHLEEVIATGVRAVVACGGAGAVRRGLALGHVVVPTGAVRDEGTSHHYLPPSRVAATDPDVAARLVEVLRRHRVPHTQGLTWTTDAPYRETPARILRRREEGCLTVEMETAALAAVSTFRGVRFGQYLYAADDVSGETWDHRRWSRAEVREQLFEWALEAVATLPVD